MPNSANARIAAGGSTCLLTYALSTDPAPVTASVPSSDPSLATLTFVVTNDSGGDIGLVSIVFSIPIGPDAASLSPGSAGISGTPRDTRWQVNGPSTPVSQGLAAFTLAPKSGADAASLPVPQGSAIVVIFKVPVNQLTGTATIDIAEHIGPAPGFTGFAITKYPPGFFFDSLTVNVGSGSDLQPVAQVPYNKAVTLSWNVSVVPLSAIAIYYSSNGGQQPQSGQPPINPAKLNQWPSPKLVNDTIFTVVVTTDTVGGDMVTAALSAAVRVQQPDIAVNHVDAQSLTVASATALNGGATVTNGLTTDTLTVNANAALAATQVSGLLSIGGKVKALGPAQTLFSGSSSQSGTLQYTTHSVATDGFLVLSFPGCSSISMQTSDGLSLQTSTSDWLQLPVSASASVSGAGQGVTSYSASVLPLGSPGSGVAVSEIISRPSCDPSHGAPQAQGGKLYEAEMSLSTYSDAGSRVAFNISRRRTELPATERIESIVISFARNQDAPPASGSFAAQVEPAALWLISGPSPVDAGAGSAFTIVPAPGSSGSLPPDTGMNVVFDTFPNSMLAKTIFVAITAVGQ